MKRFPKPLMMATFILFTVASVQAMPADSIRARLGSVNAQRTGNTNTITWSVACFVEYANFEVQRSDDGVNYETLHSFIADYSRCLQPFEYVDEQPTDKSYYRIRVGDIDGKYYSSKVIVLYGEAREFDITGIAPTLVSSNTQVSISSSIIDKARLIITSQQGKVLMQKSISLVKGNNTIDLDLSMLARGTHFLSIINSDGTLKTSYFIRL